MLENLFSFEGRVNRMTYFLTQLGFLVTVVLLVIIDALIGTLDEESGYGLLSVLGWLALVWPGIALAAKRFHDQDMSGWSILLGLIPIVGFVVQLVLLFRGGTAGENRFGEPPEPGFAL